MDSMASDLRARDNCYIYQAFNSSDELSIRLFELAPGADSERIELSLMSATLKEKPEFDALSYVWGGEEKPNAVYIGGRQLPVTANLYHALLRFRDPESSCILWIDAICIDQGNILERNQQVQIMREIYQRATKVLIWLGDEEEMDELALEMIEKFSRESPKLRDGSERMISFDELVRPLELETAPGWSALVKFLQRPWFGRLWILQEIYVAQQPILILGRLTISWDALANLIVYIRKNHLGAYISASSTDIAAGYLSVPFIHDYRKITKSTKRPGLVLLDLLLKTMVSHAKDPRDRVFALMGIVELNHMRNPGACPVSPYSSIKIDYSLTCKQVYTMVARYMLLEQKELSFLAAAGTKKDGSILNLPSWVPDWNYLNMDHALGILGFANHFKCGGEVQPDVSISDENRTLKAVGFLLDKIGRVGKHSTLPLRPEDRPGSRETQQREFQNRLAILHACDITVGNGNSDASARFPSDYWRYLVCDLTFDHQPAPQELAEGLKLYRYVIENHAAYYTGRDGKVAEIVIECVNNPLYQRYSILHGQWTHGRIPYRTDLGVCGWAPQGTEVGDWVVVIAGAGVPFVLRPLCTEGMVQFTMVGEAYAHSYMDLGARMSVDASQNQEWKRISIV